MIEKSFPVFRGARIHTDVKLATFLRFLATGRHQRTIGNGYVSSTSKVTACRIVGILLFETFINPHWINMPDSEEERRITEAFFNGTGFPGIVGCVDGKHISIKSPGATVRHL